MTEPMVTVEIPEELARRASAGMTYRDLCAICGLIQAALPLPKPDEPVGLNATVRQYDEVWRRRRDGAWLRVQDSPRPVDIEVRRDWDDFTSAVEVLWEGVQ